MNKTFIGLGVAGAVVAVVAGMFGAYLMRTPQLGGDFAGGIVPSQLFTANSGTNTLTPILSNIAVPGSITVGGSGLNNQTALTWYATSSIASTTAGAVTAATSSATSTFSLGTYMPVGTPCIGGIVPVSSTFLSTFPPADAMAVDGLITAASSTTNTATGTVTVWNGKSVALAIPSSTAVLKCDKPGITFP